MGNKPGHRYVKYFETADLSISIQRSFIGMRKHTFTLPKQASKYNENCVKWGTCIQLEGMRLFETNRFLFLNTI